MKLSAFVSSGVDKSDTTLHLSLFTNWSAYFTIRSMNGGQDKKSLFRTIEVPQYVVPRAACEIQREREEGLRRHTDIQYRIGFYERKKARAQRLKKKTAS